MVQNLFAHCQWTRQRTGKVKTTLVHHGTVVQQFWVAVPLYHEHTNGAFVWIILNLGSCVGCSEALHKLRAGSSSEEEFCFKDTFRHSRTVSLKQNSYSDVLPAPSVCCILERHCSLVCPATVPCQALLEILEICRLVRLNLDFMASETSWPVPSVETTLQSLACETTGAGRSPGQSFGGKLRGTNGIHIRILPKSKCMLDCATQLPKIGATMSFFRPRKWHRCPVLWPKGKVRLLNACVFHGCNFLTWDLMGLVFVFKKNKQIYEASLSLMIQWLPELKVWESFSNISETNPVTWICRWDVQDMSRHVVGFEALEVLATHDMGPVCHSMSQYEVVLCQCCANVASSVWDAETEPRLHGQRDLRTLFRRPAVCQPVTSDFDEPWWALSALMSSHASYDEDEFQIPQRIKSHLTMEDAMCVDPSVLKRMVHWADWTDGLWNLLTDTWLHVILAHHEFQHISRQQGLQWKCFRKLAQRNGWVLAISVGVLSLSPGSYILYDGLYHNFFWWWEI